MKKYIIIQLIIAVGILGGCTEKFDNPPAYKPVILVPNTTIAEINALPDKTIVGDKVIIWGKVVSTDRYGNIYKSLYIEDNTGGLELKIGKTTLYNTYQEGDTIYVKAEHLAYGNYSLGAPNTDPTSKYANTYLDVQLLINMTIFVGRPGAPQEPTVINAFSDINTNSYCTLVTLKNMTYTPAGDAIPTWALLGETTAGGNAKDQIFTFPGSTTTIAVRTSNFAKFADQLMPPAGTKVDLTGILTTFAGKNQFVLNSLDGVKIIP